MAEDDLERSEGEQIPVFERLHKISEWLRFDGEKYSIRQIVERLYPNVPLGDVKTWKRLQRKTQHDIERLRQLGLDIDDETESRHYVYWIKLPKPAFDDIEMLLFHTAGRLSYHRSTGGNGERIETTIDKINQYLPQNLQPLLTRGYKTVGQRSSNESFSFEHVAEAWLNFHPIRFNYVTSGRKKQAQTKKVLPYWVEVNPNNLDLYLIGLDTKSQKIRTFKLSRMSVTQVLHKETYEIPEDFNPEDFFKGAWGVFGVGDGQTEILKLRFSPEATPRIKEGGYRSMLKAIKDNPDGSLDAEVIAPVDRQMIFPRELLGWVLSFGPRIEVMGPPNLRELWLKELKSAYETATKSKINSIIPIEEESNSNKIYYAHTYSGDKSKKLWQTMQDHTQNVANRAKAFAEVFGEGNRAELAGKFHDLGKYGNRFQLRLEGKEKGLDHWSVGAYFSLWGCKDAGLALVIQGHHIGLQKGDAETLKELDLKQLAQNHPLDLRLTEDEPQHVKTLLERLQADGISLPSKVSGKQQAGETAADMLDTRMLLSALVDADHLDTEEAMRQDKDLERPEGKLLEAERALKALEEHLEQLGKNNNVPTKTRKLRADLMKACREAGKSTERLWTLTAPTGSGKTLAMLLFALTRAVHNPEIRRIVVVLPFLTILDQTADEYRKLFKRTGFDVNFVLEHHSLTGTRGNQEERSHQHDQNKKEARMLVQNWDAPIIITTNVQLLESLHSNWPSTCRKLHRLANSIILMDEVQTLPETLATTTLKTLSRLTSEKYSAVVVMATATQPAFDTLSDQVKELGNDGWQPREMAPKELQLFERSKRVKPDWRIGQGQDVDFEEVADWIRKDKRGQVLCIVNMRKHALALAERLQDSAGLKHISTSLCPAHRREIIKEVHAALREDQPVHLIATQCVEAGVDLDFPVVMRALGPLDAIAQAAGRCNRNNKLPFGELIVFSPKPLGDEKMYPTESYQRAAQLTRSMYLEGQIDLDQPETFRHFYQNLWTLAPDTTKKQQEELQEALLRQDYPKIAELYRLIPQSSVNVVVPYGDGVELIDIAVHQGIDGTWIQQARPYTVSVFRNSDGTLPTSIQPVNFKFTGGAPPEEAPDWFVAPNPEFYSELFGFQPDDKLLCF